MEFKLSESESHLKTVEEEHKGQTAKLEASLRDVEEQLKEARQVLEGFRLVWSVGDGKQQILGHVAFVYWR